MTDRSPNGEALIEIALDGAPEKIRTGTTVQELITERGEPGVHIIVELNGRCVFPSAYTTTVIANGDRIELILPLFGG